MSSQLPLALRWPAQQRFDSYVPGGNSVALALLRYAADSARSPWVFLSGAAGSGKTHLLIAACAHADAAGRSAQYLPLRRMRADAATLRVANRDIAGAPPASHADTASALRASHPDVASALREMGSSDLLALADVDAVVGDVAAEQA